MNTYQQQTAHICKICSKHIWGGQKTLEAHFAGRKHNNLLPTYITVKGPFSFDKVHKITKYFEQFGTIVKQVPKAAEDSVTIDYFFLNKKDYTKIIHTEHQIDNKKLEIFFGNQVCSSKNQVNRVLVTPYSQKTAPVEITQKPVQQNNPVNVSKMAYSEESKAAILNSVKEGKTFEEQVDILLQKLKGNPDEVAKNRKIIYNDLTAALSSMFPNHQIHFFGSSITGLDYKGSDLDVYVANVRQRNKPEVAFLKSIRISIYKSKKFCDLLLISGATVPIIKCIHTRTQICCDLNIRNRLSVANSELIKYYLSLNEKIKQLMIVVKFWAECYSLKRVNLLSGYAIYLLVIFYLQQEPYNLPAVVELQQNVPPDIEDGWNCAFESRSYSDSVLKEKSLMELVAGFFKFYSNFDYMTQVVCPFLGRPIKKICFIKPYELPHCFNDYIQQDKDIQLNSGICIQDPFEHNRNVSSAMSLTFVGKFAVLCAHIAQEILNCEVELLLYNVLTKFSSVTLKMYHFMLENFQSGDSDEESNLATFESVKELTEKILEKVLCCQVTVDSKSKQDEITFVCGSSHDIWGSRMNILKNLQTQLPSDTKEIDKEVAATACILKYFPQALSTKFSVTISLQKNPFSIAFVMRTNRRSRTSFHICHFLKMKVNEWFLADRNANEAPCDVNLQTTNSIQEPMLTDSKEIIESVTTINANDKEENANTVLEKGNISGDVIKKDEKACNNNNVDTNISSSVQNQNTNNSMGVQEVPPVHDQVDTDLGSCSETKQNSSDDSKEKSIQISNCQEEGEVVEEEEDEEDVPPDFFDDFSNQDFMDGLDIVDAWDEESGKPVEAEVDEEDPNLEKGKKAHSPVGFSSSDSYRKSSEMRSRRAVDKYERSRSKSPAKHYNRSNSYNRRPRSRSRSRDKVKISDMRRDPEKTKRDIHKDKIKCARDKEQKLVSDKLRLVETGLVPPGTEMDVDISSIIGEKRSSIGNSVERSKDERKYSRRSNSREARKSKYSRSPVYRSKIRENRIDSSYRPRRRTSSGDSNASERELWMRSTRKRTHSRSRSRSRDSSRMKWRKCEEKKKKTFLEEIRDKLNEVRPVPVAQYPHTNMPGYSNSTPHPMQTPHAIPGPHPMPVPHPIPAPVPAPNQFFHQNQNNPGMQQYDQSFFIGDSYTLGPSNNIMLNQAQPLNVNYDNMMGSNSTGIVVSQVQMTSVSQIAQMQSIQTAPKLPVLQQTANVLPKLSISNELTVSPAEQKDKQTTDAIGKLFADKKISLSDFLAITAKCEVQSSSPEHLQKKIKVISRCQDAIRAMSDERKFTGRLSVKPSSEPRNKCEVKYQSPLRRIPVVRFQFTTPSKILEEADSFAAALDKILQKIGILKETIDLDESSEVAVKSGAGSSFADEDTTALTLKASLLNSKAAIDSAGCEECKKRKLKTFTDVGTQCVDIKETVCAGTQVSEEDLYPSKGLLKNESIAYLTPAQLLGKEKEKEAPSSSVAGDKLEDKKSEEKEIVVENKKEKPKTNFKSRGIGLRKSLRDRQYNNSFSNDDYEFYDRGRPEFEDPREGFGLRFSTGIPPIRYPRHPLDTNPPNPLRMNQLRGDSGLFTDFNQPYRGRNPRFGPRY